MKTKLSELEKILKQTVQARQEVKATIAKLNASKKDYSEEYIQKFINPKIAQVQIDLANLHQVGYEKVERLLESIHKQVTEKHGRLNLDNPGLANALKVIELSGANLDGETIRKINATFEGDQSALKALKSIYKARGIAYDGGLDQQIYDPDPAFANLNKQARSSFLQMGSLNSFSSEIHKIAAKEGQNFPKTIDEQGVLEAMRTGAGLK